MVTSVSLGSFWFLNAMTTWPLLPRILCYMTHSIYHMTHFLALRPQSSNHTRICVNTPDHYTYTSNLKLANIAWRTRLVAFPIFVYTLRYILTRIKWSFCQILCWMPQLFSTSTLAKSLHFDPKPCNIIAITFIYSCKRGIFFPVQETQSALTDKSLNEQTFIHLAHTFWKWANRW